MTQVGNFWVCGRDGTTIPITLLPPDHPFSQLVASLPTPIAFAVAEFLTEQIPYIALHRLTDAAEIITRFLTIVVLSDILRQRHQFPDAVQDALTEKIERPTFGAWKDLLAIACENLPKGKGQFHCFVAELPDFVQKRWLPALGKSDDKPTESIIGLRNFIAHSARLPAEQASQLLEEHRKTFEDLIRDLAFLANYDLIACTVEEKLVWLKGLPQPDGSLPDYHRTVNFEAQPERVYLVKDGDGLDLFPLHAFTEILQWREERYEFDRVGEVSPQIYFRLSSKGYLEFVPFSQQAFFSHLKGSAYERFQEIFRLEEWRAKKRREAEAKGQLAFLEELISELTEIFVGRDKHVQQVKERIKGTERGVLWISGKPGVGKSALMAKLAKDYLGQRQHYFTFAYFFKFGQVGCSTGEFLSSALKQLQTELGRTIEPAPSLPDRQQQFIEAVREVAEKSGKKVLILVDGLDEIYRKERDFILLPFMAQANKVVWLCAGRSERELEQELRQRGAEWVFREGLPALDEEAIRAMLTEHLGRLKYQLFERDDEEGRNRFIEVVTRKSEGLPLYVRMVIEDLKTGRWSLKDEDKLPDGLNAYY